MNRPSPEKSVCSPRQLTPAVYLELCNMARRQMRRERAHRPWPTTTLVHEAYLRLLRNDDAHWRDERYFMAAAAEAMRRILIEEARRRGTRKRGGDATHGSLPESDIPGKSRPEPLLALDDALRRLERCDPRKARVVELRFFVGHSVAETAALLDVSKRTVNSEWTVARAWLQREIAATSDVG